MNMEHIREQLKEIQVPDSNVKKEVLQEIKKRSIKRKRRIKITSIVALFVIIIGLTQFERVKVVAENLYRTIHIALTDDTLVIDNPFEAVPVKVGQLDWIGKNKDQRVGMKEYTDVYEAEEELKINILENTMRYESVYQRGVPFIYYENHQMVELLFNYYSIGDLKDFHETVLENGDSQFSYSIKEDGIYKSPVSMRVMFFTETGANYQLNNMEDYNYEEKYTSPLNGITAYILKDTVQAASSEQKMLSYVAGTTTDKITVFVHDNLFYTITGNIPTSEMKTIIDSFITDKQ